MTRRLQRLVHCAIVCLFALAAVPQAQAIGSSDKADKAARFYEDALTRFEADDVAGAIVQLRNALQQDPNMLAAQILIGKAHLRKSEPSAAEVAFLKAIELGVDRSEIVVPLAQAYLDQGKYSAVLDRISTSGLPPARLVDVLLLRSYAQIGLSRLRDAEATIAEARVLDPKSSAAIIADAQLAVLNSRVPQALKLADQAIAVAPDEPAAWNMKASVLHLAGDLRGALAAYSTALERAPRYADARIARAGLYIDLGRLKDAADDVASRLQRSPDDPRALYLKAVLASRQGDEATVQHALAEITKILDPIPIEAIQGKGQILLLGGLANYGLDRRVQAQAYFEAYIRLYPNHAGARKLLGSIHLAARRVSEAIEILEPASRSNPNDPEVLSLLGEAYMAQRDYAKATTLLERATGLASAGGANDTKLGLSLIGAGRPEQALDHLKRAYGKGGTNASAGVALTMLYLKRGDARKAVEIVESLVKREPNNPSLLNLAGAAKTAAHDLAGARASYTKALAAAPAMVAASLNLAKIEVAEGNIDAARKRLTEMQRRRPKDATIMFELGRIEDAAGKRDDSARWLQKALDADRKNPNAGLYLIGVLERSAKHDRALEVAKQLDSLFPERLDVLAALTQAHLAVGESAPARAVLSRMTRIAEFDPVWQNRVAQLQLAAGNREGALYSLDKALSGDPNHVPSQVFMAEIQLQAGNVAKAEQLATMVAASSPALGQRLMGDLAMARKDYPQAIARYRDASSKEASADVALRLYRAHVESGAIAKGIEALDAWLKHRPGDLIVSQVRAEGLLLAQDLPAAKLAYERLQGQMPDNAAVANNLALVLAGLGKQEAALAQARRAVALAPTSSVTNDTLGWILVKQRQLDSALKHLREARLRDPGNAEIRYHLGAALAAAGRNEEALRELTEALATPRFAGMEDARKLVAELKAR